MLYVWMLILVHKIFIKILKFKNLYIFNNNIILFNNNNTYNLHYNIYYNIVRYIYI